jgi:hypothetical protein
MGLSAMITESPMDERSKITLSLTYVVCFAICFALSILWHELIGHGLVGILAGGQITNLNLFGFRVLPEFGWSGIPASIHIEDVATPTLHELTILTGPLSTWCVAVLALVLLWVRHWTGRVRVILVCLSLWWYDMLGETLTAWEFPKCTFFYSRPPVHYNAAVWLGIPGPLFHIFSIGTSVCLFAGLVLRLIYDHKQWKKQTGKKDGNKLSVSVQQV